MKHGEREEAFTFSFADLFLRSWCSAYQPWAALVFCKLVALCSVSTVPTVRGRDEHSLPAALGISAEETRRCRWQVAAPLIVAWLYWAACTWANFWAPGKQAGWSLPCPPCCLLSWKMLWKDSVSLLLIAAVAEIFTCVLWYCCSCNGRHLPLLIYSAFWISFSDKHGKDKEMQKLSVLWEMSMSG